MIDFKIREEGYAREKCIPLGNRYLIGNGYMGIRGTLEESGKEMLPAVNLAGLYDKAGKAFSEPLNAPNPCFSYLRVDGITYLPEEKAPSAHYMELDYRYGLFFRETTWHTPRGNATLRVKRFASMKDVHLICMKFEVSADFHADVELVTGIDCDIWEMNGPHYESMKRGDDEGVLFAQAVTQEKKLEISVAEKLALDFAAEIKTVEKKDQILHRVFFITQPDETYAVEKFCAVYTGKDCEQPLRQAADTVCHYAHMGYQECFNAHKSVWEKLWEQSQVTITGDEAAMEALNYSIYQLQSIAPRHSGKLSIPARGLSGQTYRGAVFWDTELFMLDFFLMTDPQTAHSLIKYRIDTLPGALQKAAEYHLPGAFYAWESQEGGSDACSDYNVVDVFTGRPMKTWFRDKQVHISAAVVYGIFRYTEFSGDTSLLDEKGCLTVLECARFYYGLLVRPMDSERCEIRDVIGPDEYHERVNNNGYTNRMAKYTLEKAAEVIGLVREKGYVIDGYSERELCRLREQFEDAAAKLYLPKPNADKVLEQFDGYFELENVSLEEVKSRLLNEKEYWGGAYGVASHTQIIKQADVITWLNLFAEEYGEDVLRANRDYYEPRTEHGSSLSAGMYALMDCKLREPEKAYPFFMKSATADLKGGGKEWAGLLYIGGTHPAAAGAAYMTAVEGFAGVGVENGELVCRPKLPPSFERMQFRVQFRGKSYEICVGRDENEIRPLQTGG